MTDREVMQQALNALTTAELEGNCEYGVTDALRTRLAQKEPEPVAQVQVAEDYHAHVIWTKGVNPVDLDQKFLYTAPPQREWQGLTDEEIREFELWLDDEEEKHGWNPPADIVKYLEAKLKEKNT